MTYVLIIVIDVALSGRAGAARGWASEAANTVGLVLRTGTAMIPGRVVAGLRGVPHDRQAGHEGHPVHRAGYGDLRWSPRAATLFGFADALQGLVRALVPILELPADAALATLFAVAGLVGQVSAPAADGSNTVRP